MDDITLAIGGLFADDNDVDAMLSDDDNDYTGVLPMIQTISLLVQTIRLHLKGKPTKTSQIQSNRRYL